MDKVLWKLAGVQLGLAEHMPVTAECGGTLTYRYDQQSGAEGMLFMLAAHASGAHLLAGFGSCHNAVGMSAEMMVIQDAYLETAQHITRGINTDDRHLALASLERVGPGGHFLDDTLTLELLRSDEFFQGPLFAFDGTPGRNKSLLERAHERVEELVAGFESPVPGDIQERLRRYFHDLCRHLGGVRATSKRARPQGAGT
jgi:trimethylamine--corrinoid protein Co-methyltransferase